MQAIFTKIVLLVFAGVVTLCAFDGPGNHAVPGGDAHQNSSTCSILSQCQADSVTIRTGQPALQYDGPLGVPDTMCVLSLVAPPIDHPPESLA